MILSIRSRGKKLPKGLFSSSQKINNSPQGAVTLFPQERLLKEELDKNPQLQLFIWGIHRELGSRPCLLALRCNRPWDYRKGTKEFRGEVVKPTNFGISLAEQPYKYPQNYIVFQMQKNIFLNQQRDKRSAAVLAGEEYTGALEILTLVTTTDPELYEHYQNERGIDKLFFFNPNNPEQLQLAKRHAVRLYNDNRFNFKDLHRTRTRKAIADNRAKRQPKLEELEKLEQNYKSKDQQLPKDAADNLRKLRKEEKKDLEKERSLYPDLEELWQEFSEGQPIPPQLLNFLQIAWVIGEEIVPLEIENSTNKSIYY